MATVFNWMLDRADDSTIVAATDARLTHSDHGWKAKRPIVRHDLAPWQAEVHHVTKARIHTLLVPHLGDGEESVVELRHAPHIADGDLDKLVVLATAVGFGLDDYRHVSNQ